MVMPRTMTGPAALAAGVLLAASFADAGPKQNGRCVNYGWGGCKPCCSGCECGYTLGPRNNANGCQRYCGGCDKPCTTSTSTSTSTSTTVTTTTATTTTATSTTATTTTITTTTTTETTTTTTTTSTTTTTTIGVFQCEAQWPTEQWEEQWDEYCASAGEATWAMTKDCTVAWQGGAETTALADCRGFAGECVVYDKNREECGRTRASTITTTTTGPTTTVTTNTTAAAAADSNATDADADAADELGLNTTQLFLSLDMDDTGTLTYADLST